MKIIDTAVAVLTRAVFLRPSRSNELVCSALTLSIADSWIGPVTAQHLELFGCSAIEKILAAFERDLRFRVEAEVPCRMLEEDNIARRDIPSNDEIVAAHQFNRDMAGRVAARLENSHAADDSVAGLDQRQAVLDGGQVTLRATGEFMQARWYVLLVIWVRPELPLRFAGEIMGIGITKPPIRPDRGARMIGMGMGDNDLRDRSGIDTGAFRLAASLPALAWNLSPEPISTRIRSFPVRISGMLTCKGALSEVPPSRWRMSGRSSGGVSGRMISADNMMNPSLKTVTPKVPCVKR